MTSLKPFCKECFIFLKEKTLVLVGRGSFIQLSWTLPAAFFTYNNSKTSFKSLFTYLLLKSRKSLRIMHLITLCKSLYCFMNDLNIWKYNNFFLDLFFPNVLYSLQEWMVPHLIKTDIVKMPVWYYNLPKMTN